MTWLITILLSLVPFYWHRNDLQYPFFGYGDYLSPINALQEIMDRVFMFYPKIGAGGNIAFITPHIFPFLSWHALLSYFHISPLIASLAFLSLILFFAQISMESWIHYVLRFKFMVRNQSVWLFSFLAGKLYGFAPVLIWLIAPSHVYQLIVYALFPWMLMSIDELLMNTRSKKVILPRLFLLFLFSAPAFANIGILYVLFIIFFLYVVTHWMMRQISLSRAFFVFLLIIGCALAANIWWLLPYAYTIQDTIAVNYKSNIINANISGSVGAAYLLNIFLGHPEYLLYLSPKYEIFLSQYFEIGTLVLLGCSFLLVRQWKKYRYTIAWFIMLISAVYIIKGDQPPFAPLFVWLYDNFPGFQIFRRPVSKYYFVYWFFLLTFSISYCALLYQRLRKNSRIVSLGPGIFLCIFAAAIIFAFVKTPAGTAFSIPKYYYDASSYLQKENATRVLLLPGLNGQTPSFNNNFIRYSGIDFFPIISKTEFIIPDETNYSAEGLSKPLANKIVLGIQKEQSFCETASLLGISHIVLRHDLSYEPTQDGEVTAMQQKLMKSPDIQGIKQFDPDVTTRGLSVYSIQPGCRRNLIQVSSGKITSSTIFPGLIRARVSGATSGALVKLLYNYSDFWSAYIDTEPSRLPVYIRATGLVFQDAIYVMFKRPQIALPHMQTDGYANGWRVDTREASQADIIIMYRPQYVFYLGILLLMAIVAVWIFVIRKNAWKK